MKSKQHTEVLAPFDSETQEFLRFVDEACQNGMEMLRDEKRRCELTGEEFQLTYEVMAMLNMIRGFGILYNRCIDAGWVKGLHLDTEHQDIIEGA